MNDVHLLQIIYKLAYTGHVGPIIYADLYRSIKIKSLTFIQNAVQLGTLHKVQCLLKRETNDLLFQTPPPKKETQETLNSVFHYNDNPPQSGWEG